MQYYSYIDTALRVIHINRNNDDTDGRAERVNETFRSFKGSSNFKSKLITENIKFNLQVPEVYNLLVHESHHYWQSIHYPFLFYINFLEYHSLCLMRLKLESIEDNSIAIGSLFVEPIYKINFTYCSDKFRYFWNDNNQLSIRIDDVVDNSKYDIDVFCLNDLIEEATMIFQYKVLEAAPGAEHYFLKMQNPANRGYKKLYKFLIRRFSPAYAYHFIPILVQLAFHTTEPKSMFMNLVNMTILHGLSEGKYSDMDYGVLKSILETHVDPVHFSVHETMAIEKMPVGVINSDFYREIVNFSHSNKLSIHYPLSVHALKYIDLIFTDKKIEETLIRVNQNNFIEILDRFYPFAIHFNFLDQETRNTALLCWSPDFTEIEIDETMVSYSYIIKEQMNMQDVTVNLFFNVHKETPHHCDHKDCPYYSMLLCSKWNSIPKRFENCRFPAWFAIHYHYKLSPVENLLLRVTDSEKDKFKENYLQLKKEFGRDKFSYLYKDNVATLQVPKSIIDDMDLTFILEFIEKESSGKSLVDFLSFLIIEFPDYEDDPRQVFEIPDIRSYFTKVSDNFPAIFYFLNFSTEYKQSSYILPFLVDYELTTFPDGAFNVLLNEESMLNFMEKLSFVIANFAQSQGLDIQKTLKDFFNTLLD